MKSVVLCYLFMGEKAHSRYFSEDTFKKLKGDNKELMIIPGAVHTDLYDRTDIIPFDQTGGIFQRVLEIEGNFQYKVNRKKILVPR